VTPEAGRVVGLFLLKEHGQPPQAVASATAILDQGIEGDLHGQGRPGWRRQVLIAAQEDLPLFDLKPGDLREQITVSMPGLMGLPFGARLKIGEAVFSITGTCEPCLHLGALVEKPDREAFRRAVMGHRGMLAKIVQVEGEARIRMGDAVELLYPSAAPSSA